MNVLILFKSVRYYSRTKTLRYLNVISMSQCFYKLKCYDTENNKLMGS